MQESSTKTSTKQRIIMGAVAFLLLFSTIAVYALVVFGKEPSTSGSTPSTEQTEQYLAEYNEKNKQLEVLASDYSSKYLEEFTGYKGQVKGYNATSANEKGLKTEDIKKGDGDKLTATSTGYAAYYIGWCADETVFDSSFDSFDTPSKLKSPLVVEANSLISGWYQGVDGMRLGGVRIVTIPGELAYGESSNPCDPESTERNVPLKFLIMPISVSDEFATLSKEAQTAYMRYMYALYGMTYEEPAESAE